MQGCRHGVSVTGLGMQGRGHRCHTGLRLVSAMTLASSCDWGPADFTSWRFCSRICGLGQG